MKESFACLSQTVMANALNGNSSHSAFLSLIPSDLPLNYSSKRNSKNSRFG